MAATRPASVGLLDALNDERLLGAFKPWPRQRELLAAVDAGPRVHVAAFGRRSGKSTTAAVVCLWDALLRPRLAGMFGAVSGVTPSRSRRTCGRPV